MPDKPKKKVSKAVRKGNFTMKYPDGTIRTFVNGKEVPNHEGL